MKSNLDDLFKRKLENVEISPSDEIWANIEQNLSDLPNVNKSGISYTKPVILSAIILIVAFFIYLGVDFKNETENTAITAESMHNRTIKPKPTIEQNQNANNFSNHAISIRKYYQVDVPEKMNSKKPTWIHSKENHLSIFPKKDELVVFEKKGYYLNAPGIEKDDKILFSDSDGEIRLTYKVKTVTGQFLFIDLSDLEKGYYSIEIQKNRTGKVHKHDAIKIQ